MLDSVLAIYVESKKQRDHFWTEWVSRPPAAFIVWGLARLPVTPNQVTFFALAVFATAAVMLITVPSHAGFLWAALTVQIAFIFDCVDGQLARHKNMTSPLAHISTF